ncbi:MAG: hypothetical protein ISS15_05505 [Alphaproteobacteria bacterium]|nr:hypothetical protein [Alphaproteobacteria bacterium]MBL6939423.1 hypothetical protein [Alphaproteobacteria bacterium]MBL7097096.1 hypothetical protein [Alphaproteobacteria bacterium]
MRGTCYVPPPTQRRATTDEVIEWLGHGVAGIALAVAIVTTIIVLFAASGPHA